MWEISNILNIQINKVIGENENYSYFYFMFFLLCEKINGLSNQPNISQVSMMEFPASFCLVCSLILWEVTKNYKIALLN